MKCDVCKIGYISSALINAQKYGSVLKESSGKIHKLKHICKNCFDKFNENNPQKAPKGWRDKVWNKY